MGVYSRRDGERETSPACAACCQVSGVQPDYGEEPIKDEGRQSTTRYLVSLVSFGAFAIVYATRQPRILRA